MARPRSGPCERCIIELRQGSAAKRKGKSYLNAHRGTHDEENRSEYEVGRSLLFLCLFCFVYSAMPRAEDAEKKKKKKKKEKKTLTLSRVLLKSSMLMVIVFASSLGAMMMEG